MLLYAVVDGGNYGISLAVCVLLCAGILCFKAGENEKALELFESLAELQPSNKAVLKQVQILQSKIKSKQHN